MDTALRTHGPCPYSVSHTYCASHALTTPSCFRTSCHVTIQVWLYTLICLALLYIVYKPRTYRYSTPDLFWSFFPSLLFASSLALVKVTERLIALRLLTAILLMVWWYSDMLY